MAAVDWVLPVVKLAVRGARLSVQGGRVRVVERLGEYLGWLESQRALGMVAIVGLAPVLVEDLGLEDGVEDLPGE